MKIIHELTLDVSRQGVQASVPITQHDTGIHVLLIHLRNGSKEVKLNSSLTATLYLDNDSYEVVTVYTEDGAYPNTLECNVTPYMSSNVGELTAQLQIFEGAERVLSAPEFMLVIKEDRASGSNVLSSTPYAAVVAAKAAAEDAAEKAEKAKNDATESYNKADTASEQAQTYAEQASSVARETATNIAQTVASDIAYSTAIKAVDEVANTAKNDAIAYVSDNFSNALKGKVSGTVVAMDDVSPLAHKMPVKLSSKNLLDLTSIIGTSVTANGGTLTCGADGGITGSGTPTNSVTFQPVIISLPKGEYTMSISGNFVNMAAILYLRDIDGNNLATLGCNDRTRKFSFDTSDYPAFSYARIELKRNNNNVELSGTMYAQIEKGTEATAYEPYVAEDTAVTVKSCGKNLIPYPYYYGTNTKNGITAIDNGDGSITLNGTAEKECYFVFMGGNENFPVGTYKLSGMSGGHSQLYLQGYGKDANGNNKHYAPLTTGNSITINAEYGIVGLTLYIKTGVTVENFVVKPQLELDSAVTEYEPYKEGETVTTTIADGAELNAIAPNMTVYTDTAGVIINSSYNRDINTVLNRVSFEPGTSLDPERFATTDYVGGRITEAKAYTDEEIGKMTPKFKQLDIRVDQLETVAKGKLYTTHTATFDDLMGEGDEQWHGYNWYSPGVGTLETYLHTALLNKLTLEKNTVIPSVLFDYPISAALKEQMEIAKEQLTKYASGEVVLDFINKTVRVNTVENTYVNLTPTLDNISYWNDDDGYYSFQIFQQVSDNPEADITAYFDYWWWDNEGLSSIGGDGSCSIYAEYGGVYAILTVPCDNDERAEVIKTALANGEFTFDTSIYVSETSSTVEDMQTDVDEPYITLWQESDYEYVYDYGKIIDISAKIGDCDQSNITITAMKKVE